ncbi:MAG: Tat pathway signal protein [Deltaproteobacteria bacterium]|nr:Tat pathway signal protein [Deltaproteobacteria bacterium]
MSIRITRRDFMNGVAIGAASTGLLSPWSLWAAHGPGALDFPVAGAYPPSLTGERGSHPGSYEVAHALAWRGQKPDHYESLDEHYDLVVVGAGISGLAAAWFYAKRMGPDARILILDNHDDFGGHAKRNEFHHEGRMLISLGGAQNLENPSSYSEAASDLIRDLGIDLDEVSQGMTEPHGLSDLTADNGISMAGPDGHVTVGGNWTYFMHGKGEYKEAVRALPLSSDQQEKLIAFLGGDHDFLDDLSLFEKYDYAKTHSYNQFLTERVDLGPEAIALLNAQIQIYGGMTGWNVSVLEALQTGAPGLKGMGWLGEVADSLALSLLPNLMEIYQFADGNATVARLMVLKMIPSVAPQSKGFEDVAVSRFDYEALDGEDQSTRIRLNSTVVGVREDGQGKVEVDYVSRDKPLRVSADHVILACYNGLIPHVCPELPETQKEALRYGVKIPFVYANVLLDNGHAVAKWGLTRTTCPGETFQMFSTAPPNACGGFEPPRGPDDPVVLFMMSSPTPAQPGVPARDLFRRGRRAVYTTSFESYEEKIRSQLQGVLGKYGFDHERDIRAISLNRIPHGYSYAYLSLEDPDWDEGQAPHEIGRAQFGRISIANSDSEAMPNMNAAIDAAWRAVGEQAS